MGALAAATTLSPRDMLAGELRPAGGRLKQILAKWQAAWENPAVQEKAGIVQSKATEVYESAKSTVSDKIGTGKEPSSSGVSPYPAYAGVDDASSSPS